MTIDERNPAGSAEETADPAGPTRPLDTPPLDTPDPMDDTTVTDPEDVAATAAPTDTMRKADSVPDTRPASRWRTWRRTRPFWGAMLILLSGIEILISVRAPLPVVLKLGMQGAAAYLVPVLLILCGLLLLFSPAQRPFYAILSIVLALSSWLTSNLGGFLLGLLLGLVGGALAFAWTPHRTAGVKRRA